MIEALNETQTQSQLEVTHMSSQTEQMGHNKTDCLWITIYTLPPVGWAREQGLLAATYA